MTPIMSLINVCINYSDSVPGALMRPGHVEKKKVNIFSPNKWKLTQKFYRPCFWNNSFCSPSSISTASISTLKNNVNVNIRDTRDKLSVTCSGFFNEKKTWVVFLQFGESLVVCYQLVSCSFWFSRFDAKLVPSRNVTHKFSHEIQIRKEKLIILKAELFSEPLKQSQLIVPKTI